MMMLSREQFSRARAAILRTARPIEAAQFALLFEDGSAQDVLRLLALYQNADGGFGHALEPDLWNPDSTPYASSCAAKLLLLLETPPDHPIVERLLRYLRSGEGFEDGLWCFTLPSNDAHPHAPWWQYDAQANRVQNLGLSCELAAFILGVCGEDDPLLPCAHRIAQLALERFLAGDMAGEMTLGGYAALLPHWLRLSMIPQGCDVIARIRAAAKKAIVCDPARFGSYVPRPSSAVTSPASPLYPDFKEAIAAELDWLISTLPDDGLWPISWSWMGNAYADAFAVSRTWWEAQLAIRQLMLLRAFGRIEGMPPA